jgi:GAF domain-containing protein
VVPIYHGEEVVAVLDIDSERLNEFDDIDRQWLEKLVALL